MLAGKATTAPRRNRDHALTSSSLGAESTDANIYTVPQYIGISHGRRAGEKAILAFTGPWLCGILDTVFREQTFYEVG